MVRAVVRRDPKLSSADHGGDGGQVCRALEGEGAPLYIFKHAERGHCDPYHFFFLFFFPRTPIRLVGGVRVGGLLNTSIKTRCKKPSNSPCTTA